MKIILVLVKCNAVTLCQDLHGSDADILVIQLFLSGGVVKPSAQQTNSHGYVMENNMEMLIFTNFQVV